MAKQIREILSIIMENNCTLLYNKTVFLVYFNMANFVINYRGNHNGSGASCKI